MKILLVSSFLPYPLFSGGHIRLYNIIKGLSYNHEITLVCEKRDYQTKDDIKEVEKFCKKVIAVDRKKQWTLSNIVKTFISTDPFLVVGHTNEALKQAIVQLLNNEEFDLIHVETSYVMQNVPKTDIPLVLVEHNVEYLVYKRFTQISPLFLRPILYLDVLKLKIWEEKMWIKATKLVSVSEAEKKIMGKIRKDVVVVSNGVDIQKFKVQPFDSGTHRLVHPSAQGRSSKFKVTKEEKRVLFIGDFKWVQNRDAIEWIIKEIWPKLIAEFVPTKTSNAVKLWVVGRNIPDSIKKLTNDKSISFDENAPKETELIYREAHIALTPIRVGGGTSFKVLEAMASGVPVITTPLGNMIEAKDNLEIVIAQSPQDFIHSIKKLLEDRKFYEIISINALKLVEEKYNWKEIVRRLEEVYESASRDAEIHSTSSGS